jgi:hypothetical protein
MHPTLSRAFAFLSRSREAAQPPVPDSRLQRLVERQKPGRAPPPAPHWGDFDRRPDEGTPLYASSVYAAEPAGQREL